MAPLPWLLDLDPWSPYGQFDGQGPLNELEVEISDQLAKQQ